MDILFETILKMSLSATVVAGAVLLLRPLLRKAPRWITCALWALVAVRLLCPLTLESPVSMMPDTAPVAQQVVSLQPEAPIVSTGGVYPQENGLTVHIQSDIPKQPFQFRFWMAWAVGVAGMLVYLLISYLTVRRRVRVFLDTEPGVRQCDTIDTPFILGIFRPVIYLPSALSPESRDFVLAHERAHLRRKDHWWKPLGFLLLSLHWFNPVLWLSYILLCRDIELACDEKVIREMDSHSRADYTQALVTCSIHRRSIAACPLAFGEVGVKERVKSVMNYKKPAFWIIVAAIIACIAVAVCFLTDPKTNTHGNISDSLVNQNDGTTQFFATVLEVHDTYLMVAPEPGSPLGNTDQVEVSLAGLEIPSNLQVGETVLIVYDGYVQEIYPPRICTAYKLERLYLDSGPVETIYGNVKTYFRNTNGTWQTDGRNYLYRHVLTGRMPNASADSSFIYLSNLEHITFEQAYKAAGYSSNCADWFLVEDAVLVGCSVVEPGGAIEQKLDAAIQAAILSAHADAVPEGYLATESHILVQRLEANLDDDIEREGMWCQIYYLHLPFDVSGNVPVEHELLYKEAILVFRITENGEYEDCGFFYPENGRMPEGYEGHKSSGGLVDISDRKQQFQVELRTACWTAALNYAENRAFSEYQLQSTASEFMAIISNKISEIEQQLKNNRS